MLGRLSWAAIPFNEPLPLFSAAAVCIVIAAVLLTVIIKGWWPYLWREWLTSVDHKRIGVMYVVLGLVMLLRGYSDAIMMRTQQAIAIGDAQGYLPPDHYNQIFSAHGPARPARSTKAAWRTGGSAHQNCTPALSCTTPTSNFSSR